MFLKNYTSDVPVSESIAKIEKVLLRCGVSRIEKEYVPGGNGKIQAVTVSMEIPKIGTRQVRLPADERAAAEMLWRDYMGDDLRADGTTKYNGRKGKKRTDFVRQGERTAWKLMLDWV